MAEAEASRPVQPIRIEEPPAATPVLPLPAEGELGVLERVELAAAPPVLSSIFDLSTHGELDQVELFGWYEAEAEGRWSRADLAEMTLPVPPGASGELTVEIFGRVYGTNTGGPARVRIAIEDGPPTEVIFEKDNFRRRSATLRHDAVAEGARQVRLSLIRLDPISPADAGEGDDSRRLGVLVRTLGVVWR